MKAELTYLAGFANYLQSEAVAGALPQGCNSPQQVPLGLYAEQLNGSAFTAPSHHNFRSWLYRILPSATHGPFRARPTAAAMTFCKNEQAIPPTQMRWDPQPYPASPTDFLQGLIAFAKHGDASQQIGAAIHLYTINQSMTDHFFYNADGDFLFVPQEGGLRLKTEFGILEIAPGEVAVIQRGMCFQVELLQEKARGYVCENFGAHFSLPARGPIGANGLANERDFQIPTAHYEQKKGSYVLVAKFAGQLWEAAIDHSPLNVVAWHGNYLPYKYNLRHFNTMNTVSYDHPDPSIFTVLTSLTNTPGIANVDFVIFPERWMVAENTFRPPYYHRNIMSEFMGLIYGTYDAKKDGFIPGGCSLHNCMSAHGPDAAGYEKGRAADLQPEFYRNTLAFMFESRFAWQPTDYAMTASFRQQNYLDCWKGLKMRFQG